MPFAPVRVARPADPSPVGLVETGAQAAEKALKGLLIALGEEPPHSHSLDRRVELWRRQGRLLSRCRNCGSKP
jgi:hypothetical protein